MKQARVKRSQGPKSTMTEATYRKKALPFLLKDFESRCAYCLDPGEFRAPSQNHIDHFNCLLRNRARHQYKNLMLACSACNLSKHAKPVVNPLDSDEHLLNCTEENEFPQHIIEDKDGQWHPTTKAGYYHLESIGLREYCHKNKRAERRKVAERLLDLCTKAILYQASNPIDLHNGIMGTIKDMINLLDKFPPLITEHGALTVRDWLRMKGVDVSRFV
jgi:hypothetical protein